MACLQVEFITYALNCRDTIQPEFLPDLADMHIDCAVAYDHLVAPYLVQDLIA